MPRWRLGVISVLLLGGTISVGGQTTNLAARLEAAIRTAGVPIVGVSIGDPAAKVTWKVSPSSLQGAAQPIIDAFDMNNPAHEQAELDARVKAALDNERLISAVVWTIIDTYSPPATRAKYLSARQKIIDAYTAQSWKP